MGAGAGFKTFVTGDVLTAADTNGYLMQGVWTFANAAARDAAVTSPQEGNFCYLKDTNATQYYTGSAWTAIGGGGGKVLQVLNTIKTDTFTSSSTTPVDVTGLSVTITPSSATSKIMVFVTLSGNGTPATSSGVFRLLRGATDLLTPTSPGSRASGFGALYVDSSATLTTTSVSYLDSPASTSALTYKIQGFSNVAGNFYINRSSADTDNLNYIRTVSSITVMEIGA
jgi:hypothetical protein